MRSMYKICAFAFTMIICSLAVFTACKKESHSDELPAAVQAAFTVTPVSGRVNTYLLTVTTPGAFAYRWDIGDGAGSRPGSRIDTAYYPEKGTFTIRLYLSSKGGITTATQTVTVTADDPNGCFGAKAKLTGCSQRTWVLKHDAGALWVGPNDVGASAWWSNGAGDVNAADRTCLFNDEYTFKKDGAYLFDDKGDMRVDDENGGPWPTGMGLPIGCFSMSQIPALYKPWGTGSFTFKIIGGNKLQVNGLGAHIGLYKAGDAGTIDQPEITNTYEIMSITDTEMQVRKVYSWGQWRFTLAVK
jgi:hypothetical protein